MTWVKYFFKGICIKDLQIALEFIYCGQVNVEMESLDGFLRVAEELAIKGLSHYSKPIGVFRFHEPFFNSISF